jgi:dTDP-4-amino-4,6-dideoxygalactose transaminase
MMALDIRPGDEVILPSFTFVSTANCIMRQGATPVFADIRPDTHTLDVSHTARRITPRTKAILPVGYAGVSPEMNEIVDLARSRSLAVVEDAAQSIGAFYRDRPQGALADIACYSFHETKNVSAGEAGAFATNNESLAARAEIIREKGTNRKQFIMHLVDKYTWVDVGSSFLPSDLTAALLLSQLKRMDSLTRARERIYRRYMDALAPLMKEGLLTLPTIPTHSRSNYHIFHVLFKDEPMRNRALTFFAERNVGATFHYLPLHLSSMGSCLGYTSGDFPVTESVSGRLMRLPIYPALSTEQQDRVLATMIGFFQHA